jgi:DNA-binding NarL/FixJ family response regulator
MGSLMEAALPSPLRTLVIDDDSFVRLLLTDALGLIGDVEVVKEAASAEEALALLPGAQVDAVLIDLEMPVMSGLEGTRRLRRILPHAGIVVYSAHHGSEVEPAAADAGADAYLAKGSPLTSVVAALSDAVRRRAIAVA